MKKFLFLILSLATLSARAQTADDIIQKYTAAMGGLDAFQKVQTAKFTGSVTVQGYDLPLTMQVINGRAMRMDVDAMGQMIVNCYKDGKGWKINPFEGIETATDVEGKDVNDLKVQASLASILMDYKNLGHTVEFAGIDKVEGVGVNKIKLTSKDDGRVTTYFIGVNDNILLKASGNREIQGADTEIETWYSNLKEFAGLKFFMTRTQKMGGQTVQSINFTNVELNVQVDEKIFEK